MLGWCGRCVMYTANLAAFTTGYAHLMCRGVEWGVEGSRLEAWMKSHKSEVAIT